MAPAFGIINELEAGKGKYGLELRVIRLFETSEYRNKNEAYSYDCVLHDKTGSRVHATIGKNLIPKFKSILSEGKVYAFMNFVVAENVARYKTSDSKYKLLIFNQTRICEVTDESFPTHTFNFKSFDEIKELKKTQDGLMFDVIGAIGSCYKPELRETNETTTKLVDFVCKKCFFNEGDVNYCQVECNSQETYTRLYLTNKAAALMGTTSKVIILQTPVPRAFEVYYEYRKIGSGTKSSFMIRLTNGWSDVAEDLNLVRGNVVRFNKCDRLAECYHIKQIEVVNIDVRNN